MNLDCNEAKARINADEDGTLVLRLAPIVSKSEESKAGAKIHLGMQEFGEVRIKLQTVEADVIKAIFARAKAWALKKAELALNGVGNSEEV